MALILAQKLCEAVENEDAREVENLLKCGADPNLVLPNGIAAIHLASGKESESAHRCLTLILQNGGDPNVRSIEELTPVHVASSWGCCKALICLLRRGGDPSIQDQDGNTALDLALLEKNRRCVVALQEYQRNEDSCPEKSNGYLNNYTCLSNDFPELSNITLLLESTYEMSPLCSTKMSPFIPNPKNPTTANDAILVSQLKQAKSENNYDKDADLGYSELLQNENGIITNNSYSNLKVKDSNVACAAWASETSYEKKDYTSCWHTDDTNQDNLLTEIKEHLAESINTHTFFCANSSEDKNSGSQSNETVTFADPSQWETVSVSAIIKNNAKVMMNSSTLTQLKMVEKWEGLDVTSPDHVYTYIRGHSDDDLEKTLLLPEPCEDLEEPGKSSDSKYTSCSSEGFTTLVQNSFLSGNKRVLSKSSEDINPDQICSQNSGDAVFRTNFELFHILNEQDSVPGILHTLQASRENHDNKECSGMNTQLLNPNFDVVKDDHEIKIDRTTEVLCLSPSPTLPIETTNSESCSQDLGTKLRNLLLATKNCKTNVKQDKCSASCSVEICSASKASVPIGLEKTVCPDLNNTSLSSSNTMVDTFVLESSETKIKDGLNPELHEELKKMMLATKAVHPSPILNEERIGQCFFTPRAKSRLLSFESRHSNSSLFDESVEMPQRYRRVGNPDNVSKCLQSSDSARIPSDISVRECPISTVPSVSVGENVLESDSNVSIGNFLTDDLSSESEGKCNLQDNKATKGPYFESRISESMWLTEETESSDHNFAVNGSGKFKESSTDPLQNGSLLHSTLIEDAAVHSTKVPRYSFSRLSCVTKADDAEMKLCKVTSNPTSEDVTLSPGGRPINKSHCEPIEYLYMDNEEGHALIEKHIPCSDRSSSNISDDTILYDWRNYKSCKQKINKDSPASTPNRVAVELYRLSNDEIARRLRELGEDPGQVNTKTRRVCIFLLDKLIKDQATSYPGGLSFEYSPELSLALRTYNIPDCNNDEANLSREFDQPDKTKKWREGVLKSSFNYLLLDPRVTQNLPALSHTMSLPDCFRTFVRAVFYVGKGKRARPYCHLYEALAHYKGSKKLPCSKIQHIVDIWKSGQGVLSLHCFQNTIPVEAYTREACMVDAFGLKMLTNQKKGVYYGQVQNWTPTRRRRLGVHMLHRAMQIFLAEGERQLRPPDI